MTRTAHLLIVDDEDIVLSLTKRGLERFGHRVTTFNSSIAALKAFTDIPDSFDLIIADKNMPSMTGLELLSKMRVICDNIPVILFTGFIDSEQEEEIEETIHGIKILLKPLRMQALQEEILDTLQAKSHK